MRLRPAKREQHLPSARASPQDSGQFIAGQRATAPLGRQTPRGNRMLLMTLTVIQTPVALMEAALNTEALQQLKRVIAEVPDRRYRIGDWKRCACGHATQDEWFRA